MALACEICGKRAYSNYCMQHKPRKPIKQRGKRTIEYENWRDNVARPHLDKKGRRCAQCGAVGVPLDVDHIKNRGSHYHLRMNLSNVQYLCRPCHRGKTDRLNKKS